LLVLLAQKRPYELKLAWQEAHKRGKEWQRLLREGAGQLTSATQDQMLEVIGSIPGLPTQRTK